MPTASLHLSLGREKLEEAENGINPNPVPIAFVLTMVFLVLKWYFFTRTVCFSAEKTQKDWPGKTESFALPFCRQSNLLKACKLG